MKIKIIIPVIALSGFLAGAVKAEPIYPSPTGLNAGQYGDFYSYSLPILAYSYDLANGGGTGPGNPFYISSTPGQIADDIVVATGVSGGPVTTNIAGMDDAYATPTGVNGSPLFSTRVDTDPGGAGEFAGDSDTTWDARVETLLGFLGGEDLFFYFNNNQINSGAAANQNLYAAAQVILGSDAGGDLLYFDFLNNGGLGPILDGDVTTYTSSGAYDWSTFDDYVLSGGQICTNADVTAFLDCADAGAVVFNHNLGADQAAYAVYSPELMAALLTGDYDYMRVDLGFTDLNNGYEQLFIRASTADNPNDIPLPSTLALFMIGFLSLLRKKHS